MSLSKVLFVGQLNKYSTSYFRLSALEEILGVEIKTYDILNSFEYRNKFQKSIAWRYYFGSIIRQINNDLTKLFESSKEAYDLIWIDKGTFIYPSTLELLRSKSRILLHYTPDTAFYQNNSRFFRKGLHLYDFLITTKSFDLEKYYLKVPSEKVIFLSQGHNKITNKEGIEFNSKKKEISFIGLCEPYREKVILILLREGFKINLGGIGWDRFISKNKSKQLIFLGEKVFGTDYFTAISRSAVSLGLLSKKFPELHTTRTFEIPACGTCLITEKNDEIDSFFNDNECIKFRNLNEMVSRIKSIMNDDNQLALITTNGFNRVNADGRDYQSQLHSVINKICSTR